MLPVAQRRKISRPHVQNMYRKSDTAKKNPIGKAINARSELSLSKQVSRLPDSSGILFHIVNTKTGEEIRAVSKTQTVGGLKQAIDMYVSQGLSWDEAFFAAIYDSYDLYEDDSDITDQFPAIVSNVVVYFEVA